MSAKSKEVAVAIFCYERLKNTVNSVHTPYS